MPAKASITLRLDADLLRHVRHVAAKQGTTLSRLVAEQIEKLARDDAFYEPARRAALARMKRAKPLGWRKPASRDELHDR
ncbi:MAG: BrnA antitoxin family protein [Vicinamibacteria bacterium]|nr:BrnA antitoxin family protein [Vicinamibacteria bacterium]